MPVVEVDPDELRSLADVEADDEQLRSDLFELGLEFEGLTDEGAFELEFAPDRLDRLCVEGIARSLRYQYGKDRGVHIPRTNDAEWTIRVDESVPAKRPYVTGAVVRGLDLDERTLESLIQLQEKLHATMGRTREKGAIGVHDLTMLKGTPLEGEKTIRYTGIDPEEETFVPLESDEEMTPADVLEDHPIGTVYADIVDDYDQLPAIYDDIGLFSFPPIVNGRRTEVTTDSRDLFIEMTGTDQWTIDKMLAIVCYMLDARGGTIESVEVTYEHDKSSAESLIRPDFSTKTKTVGHDRIETIIGTDFTPEEVTDLLERAGLEGTDEDGTYEVTIPPYRVDVLHPIDVIDDVGRAFGFSSLQPTYPDVSTVGQRHERSRHEEAIRQTLVGLGFEDTLNFHLTNEATNYSRMELPVPTLTDCSVAAATMNVEYDGEPPAADVLGLDPAATIKEPYSEEYTIVRTWALPSLLSVLEGNTHRQYPQDLAEVGFVAWIDPAEPTGVAESRHVAGVVARHDATFEDARGRVQTLAGAFDVPLETKATAHPSFIEGRVATVELDGEAVGVCGEFHPAVITEFGIEIPVVGFEFDAGALR